MKWSQLIFAALLAVSTVTSSFPLMGAETQRDQFLTKIRPRSSPSPHKRSDTLTNGPITIGNLNLLPCDPNVVGSDKYYCVNLTVPVDYTNPTSYHIQVPFFVKPASNPPTTGGRKAFIYIEGGPGSVIHGMMDFFDAAMSRFSLLDDHDLIFMEQRCMGWACGLGCIQSLIDAYSKSVNSHTTEQFAMAMANYKVECDAEIQLGQYQSVYGQCMIDGADLTDSEQRSYVGGFCGTRHAVQDLESFLAMGGYTKIALYGPSYGGIFGQTYAGMFPDRIESLILDATLDTDMNQVQKSHEYMKGRQDAWKRAGELCYDNYACRTDLCNSFTKGRRTSCLFSKVRAVQEFMAGVTKIFDPTNDSRMVMLPYVTLNDTTFEPIFGISLKNFSPLVAHTMNVVGLNPHTRTSIVRRVISGIRGNLLPVTKGYYAVMGLLVNPETMDVNIPLWTTMYNGLDVLDIINGQDYIYKTIPGPATPLQLAEQYINGFTEEELDSLAGVSGPGYFSSSAGFSDVNSPVYSLTAQNSTYMPSPGIHNYPIIIMQSTIDTQVPATFTPILINKYISTGPTYVVRTSDAGHVLCGVENIYGWLDDGEKCAEQALDRMISFGNYSKSIQTCKFQHTFAGYLPLPPINGVSTAPMAAKQTVLEIMSLPEYQSGTNFAAICDNGGFTMWQSATLPDGTIDPTVTQFSLNMCSFFNGWTVSGVGEVIKTSPVQHREKGDVQMMLEVTDFSGQSYPYIVIRDAASGTIVVLDGNTQQPVNVD